MKYWELLKLSIFLYRVPDIINLIQDQITVCNGRESNNSNFTCKTFKNKYRSKIVFVNLDIPYLIPDKK